MSWLNINPVSAESLVFFQRKLENLEELENEADLVVNCCGLGAADLVSYFFLLPMVMTAITFSTS